MLRRGAKAGLCHFHSYPFTDKSGARKAEELAAMVARWQGNTNLYLVPFGDTQQQIVVASPPALRVVLYRRFMMRVACTIAVQEGAKALVTGESLGQVASQTLENMTCIERASALPVLRPLVGDDKQDIVAQAKAIGTYETSILPYADCCALFVPRSPETRATLAECEEAEAALAVRALVDATVARVELVRVRRPGREDTGS
jgi:thiamine biosynthesis protein ThiI